MLRFVFLVTVCFCALSCDTEEQLGNVSTGVGSMPEGAFFITPTWGSPNTSFIFDARVSDAETPTEDLRVRWDFNGDESFETEWSKLKYASHRYGLPGAYQAVMAVKDDDGNEVHCRQLVVVELEQNDEAALVVRFDSGALATDGVAAVLRLGDHAGSDLVLRLRDDGLLILRGTDFAPLACLQAQYGGRLQLAGDAADLDGCGQDEWLLVETRAQSPGCFYLLAVPTQVEKARWEPPAGERLVSAETVDLDADGLTEIICRLAGGRGLVLDAMLSMETVFDTAWADPSAALGRVDQDANGDGCLDLELHLPSGAPVLWDFVEGRRLAAPTPAETVAARAQHHRPGAPVVDANRRQLSYMPIGNTRPYVWSAPDGVLIARATRHDLAGDGVEDILVECNSGRVMVLSPR